MKNQIKHQVHKNEFCYTCELCGLSSSDGDGLIGNSCLVSSISDGYHTFDELYNHRITLWIILCKYLKEKGAPIYRSKVHNDGSVFEGWFILGLDEEKGKQISYHLPLSRWNETDFALTLDKSPEWDGHTSQDVIERLKQL